MIIDRIRKLLLQNEGIHLEFKEAKNALPKNVFESICAFLNREGGVVILGVDDDGNVTGVNDSAVNKIKKDLVDTSNNPNKLTPSHIVFPQSFQIEGENIIVVEIPISSEVHQCNGKIYDRSEDGDYVVKNPSEIAKIYNQKKNHYTENEVFTYATFDDFKPEVFPKIKNLIRSHRSGHPWLALDDEQMLKRAGFYKKDIASGEEGYTLAAILLFGKDEVIQSVLPFYKIDVLVRRENLDRYDDRLYITCNLIDAYDEIMNFVSRHLPDKFYMEGDQRVSLRGRIFREVVANLIVHREYTNAYPATFIIYKDRVEIKNANVCHGRGAIDINTFTPFSKNPAISKFFIQLGRCEELGSGVVNITRYLKQYSPSDLPVFTEDEVFTTIIPISNVSKLSAKISTGKTTVKGILSVKTDITNEMRKILNVQSSDEVLERLVKIISLIYQTDGVKTPDIAMNLDIPKRSIERDMKLLREKKVVEYSGSLKTGRYLLTSQGNEIALKILEGK